MSNKAFGSPGLPPAWSRAAKHGVGTAMSDASKVWFTIADGVVTEVYYPRVDSANTKDIRFLVTDSRTFFDEEGKDTTTEISYIDPKAPAYLVTNTAKSGAYVIRKKILTDPRSNSLVMNVSFEALRGNSKDHRLFILFAPHIKNRGFENSGRCATYGGKSYLIAGREDIAAALTSDAPFIRMSAGYSGFSDGWQDLKDNRRMDWTFEKALDGNIALMAEVRSTDEFNIVLAFGKDEVEAVLEAGKTLTRKYKQIEREYIKGWKGYIKKLSALASEAGDAGARYWTSAFVLKTHEDKTHKGGLIASLSIPWGEAKGDEDGGGYHLVWPRDLVKGALAFMAMGDMETPVNTLKFLERTQNPDGSWPQNMWLDGSPYWTAVQLDEVALPVVLAYRLKKMGVLDADFYPMVKKAVSYLLQWGPVTEQERWEEQMGFSPSTIATEIAALICAADWALEEDEYREASYMLSMADYWATRIEEWTFSNCDCMGENTPGHYLRIVQPDPEALPSSEHNCHMLVFVKNLPSASQPHHQGELVDAGFLDLVRYGLRDPKDPRILSSLKVVDGMIRFEHGGLVAFYRYNWDGYGEKEDGSPFDGSGVGRPWPLITGERAMYEAMAGSDARRYLESVEGFANEGLLLPEQIWDRADIAERRLFTGKGTGGATPLMWAHSEYIKILRTLKDGKGCDLLETVRKRYVEEKTELLMSAWKHNKPIHFASTAETVRIITHERASLRWSADGWKTVNDSPMTDTGLGVYYYDFAPGALASDSKLTFTFRYPDRDAWEGKDYEIRVFEPVTQKTMPLTSN
ncbi:MAG: glucan 1,4-alpha-glucosidase [Deltaproteobacteria bacterium]|nr:glucan 1,4-alpha-glucosidase [Deltaproteobacteria bacterium]